MKRVLVGVVAAGILALMVAVPVMLLRLNVSTIAIDSSSKMSVTPGWGGASGVASASSQPATATADKPAGQITITPSNPSQPWPAAPLTSSAAPAMLAPDQLFAAASPAVVRVQLMDAAMLPTGQGTGFFVSEDGYLVTNFHVIRDAAYASIVTADGLTHAVEGVAASNEQADLALLKVRLATDRVPTLRLAVSNVPPAIGTRVFAIGNPRGLTNTLSDGLVSGHRDGIVPGVNIVQISAPISAGSSGGPLMTADGAVVGVTSSGFSDGQNLNFAIPSERVHALLARKSRPRPLTPPEAANPIRAMADAAGRRNANGDRVTIIGVDGGVGDGGDGARSGPRVGGSGEIAVSRDDLDLLTAAARAIDRRDTRTAAMLLRELRPRCADVYTYWGLDGLLNEQLGQFELAIRSHRKSAALNPKSPAAYMGLGRCLSAAGDDRGAIDAFHTASQLEPNNAMAYMHAGVCAARMKDFKRAFGFFDWAVRLAPKNHEGHRLRGMALADMNRTREAFAAYDQALKLNPRDGKTHHVRGQLKLRLNRPGEAIDSLKRAVQYDPANAGAYVTLGDAHEAVGEKADALKAWVAAARLDKSGRDGRMARARLERATMGMAKIE